MYKPNDKLQHSFLDFNASASHGEGRDTLMMNFDISNPLKKAINLEKMKKML